MIIGVGEHSYGYLSTVKEDTKQRTSCTTAITIAHRAQHNTTGYSSWTITITSQWPIELSTTQLNIWLRWEVGFDLKLGETPYLQESDCGQQCGEDVDGVGDVDQAGRRVLKSWPGFQVWGVNVHQQHPQNHLTIRSIYIFVGTEPNFNVSAYREEREDDASPYWSPNPPRLRSPFLCGLHLWKRVFRSLVRYCGVYAFSVEGQRAYIVLSC